MKLSKPIMLQILFNILLTYWILGLVFKTSWLFWLPIAVILPLMVIVVCWGQIKIKRRK